MKNSVFSIIKEEKCYKKVLVSFQVSKLEMVLKVAGL